MVFVVARCGFVGELPAAANVVEDDAVVEVGAAAFAALRRSSFSFSESCPSSNEYNVDLVHGNSL